MIQLVKLQSSSNEIRPTKLTVAGVLVGLGVAVAVGVVTGVGVSVPCGVGVAVGAGGFVGNNVAVAAPG